MLQSWLEGQIREFWEKGEHCEELGEGARKTEEVSGENKESIVSSLREGQEIYRGKKKKTREEVISGVAGCSSRKKLERKIGRAHV